MLDVFSEEDEILIKDGISNLYWYKADLRKAWLRSGVPVGLCTRLFALCDEHGQGLTKRRLMDQLYLELRGAFLERRLEISRNFVRILIEHKSFAPQSDGHRIEVAERAALKLRELIAAQREEREQRDRIQRRAREAQRETYDSQLSALHNRFVASTTMAPQPRGYELEKIFVELLRISGIHVEEPFRIAGEQIDGALKYDGHYYLVEIRWRAEKADQQAIAGLYLKVEGKFEARGIFLAMNGYSPDLLHSLPRGKEIRVLLLDGVHLMNVLCGQYTFQQLLEHAISHASLRANIHCPHTIQR